MMHFLTFCLVLGVCGAGRAGASVVGGDNANIANHPWQASLRNSGNHVCGAVLITSTKAVTAAHCGGGAIAAYEVVAGTTERTEQTCATCAMRPALTFARHPNFANNPAVGYPNDIGVVSFYSIAHNVNIQYATMATDEDGDFVGASSIVTGWGRQTAGGPLPTTLQEGALTVVSNEECVRTWGAQRINDGHVCAVADTVSFCGGDDGGPLVSGEHFIGIASWNEASCSPNFPAVFSRISFFRDWILEN